jgi:hypothetical protein
MHTRTSSSLNWLWLSLSRVLYYDRRSVGQSVLGYSTHLGLTTRSLLLADICGFVDVGRSLWREVGSVVYIRYWSSTAQSFSGTSPLGLVTIFYCLRFEIFLSSPPTTRRVTVQVFNPASTRELTLARSGFLLYNVGSDSQGIHLSITYLRKRLFNTQRWFVSKNRISAEKCLPSRCLAAAGT